MELKDKVPPHDLDAEQATLGAMLLDWKCVSEIVARVRPWERLPTRNSRTSRRKKNST